MLPTGIGPASQPPEGCTLSVELWEPAFALTYIRASFSAKATKDKSMGNIIFSDLSSESLLKEEARMQMRAKEETTGANRNANFKMDYFPIFFVDVNIIAANILANSEHSQ